ncbi:LOW QUALITY PROTEIN: hypothetical protein KIPB_013529 [Kipferlia bialata]|uniref:Uncharacterized protein n=1 Tax=Kipferlia bialata TaxID=797122 RepID=A0A9K3GQB4_9EUKA|nr:LOW QUALITY PROTEIN: hypothetical protein KIPB_013529 [Kipferlia bialata]
MVWTEYVGPHHQGKRSAVLALADRLNAGEPGSAPVMWVLPYQQWTRADCMLWSLLLDATDGPALRHAPPRHTLVTWLNGRREAGLKTHLFFLEYGVLSQFSSTLRNGFLSYLCSLKTRYEDHLVAVAVGTHKGRGDLTISKSLYLRGRARE